MVQEVAVRPPQLGLVGPKLVRWDRERFRCADTRSFPNRALGNRRPLMVGHRTKAGHPRYLLWYCSNEWMERGPPGFVWIAQ